MREIKPGGGGKRDPLSILLQDKIGGGGGCLSWRLEDGGVGSTQTECVHIDLRLK